MTAKVPDGLEVNFKYSMTANTRKTAEISSGFSFPRILVPRSALGPAHL